MLEVPDRDKAELKKIPTMKLYRVFNLDQTTITASSIPENEIVQAHIAEQIRDNFQDKPVIYPHPQPHYNPIEDKIWIPHKNDFNLETNYRATLFHEGIHSTGSEKRMGRKEVMDRTVKWGDCDYSKEELGAELGAAYLSAFAGIQVDTIENSAAYVKGWMMKIKDNLDLLMRASADGWKACEYILNIRMDDVAKNFHLKRT